MLRAVRKYVGLLPDVRLPSPELRDPFQFFSAIDRLQTTVYQRLRSSYPDSFCKLLAIKISNGLTADYHFRTRHSVLVSHPIQLQVDPTNACHLHCPSCLHTTNSAWASRFDWPSGTLTIRDFDEFCDVFGPFATGIALFRDGEPLLHRRFPEFVTRAKGYLLYTLTSTSLSMRLDADSLVASGLDRLVAAIDGASAATYNRYRRGGNFDLVIENLRAIVRARNSQSTQKPWLVWQFLAFEHNVHEIEDAERLARQIGVEQFIVAKPHSVEHDDPDIQVARAAPFGERLFAQAPNWCGATERAAVRQNAERIDQAFDESWVDRYRKLADSKAPSGPESTCKWLYYSLTMDAARRITPCCLPPMGPPEPRHLVYGKFSGNNGDDVINSPLATLSRAHCRSGEASGLDAPYCLTCTQNPSPPMWPDVSRYLRSVDERRELPEALHRAFGAAPLFAPV